MSVKKVINYLFLGISWGCTFFVFTCLIGYLISGPAFLAPVVNNFPRQVLGAVFVGIACGSTRIVYRIDRLSLGIQILIHFTLGMSGYFLAAFFLGWIPLENKWYMITFIILGVLIFTAIWSIFFFYNRREARKMNERLKELNREEQENK